MNLCVADQTQQICFKLVDQTYFSSKVRAAPLGEVSMEWGGNRDTFIGMEVTRTVLGKGPDFLTLGTAASTVENVEKCERNLLSLDLIMAEGSSLQKVIMGVNTLLTEIWLLL